jgi:hypothetical protein
LEELVKLNMEEVRARAERTNKAIETIRRTFKEFAEACIKIWEQIKKHFKDFMLGLRKYFTLNFKRLARIKSRIRKQQILANNTNNWRKLHGLPLARNSC